MFYPVSACHAKSSIFKRGRSRHKNRDFSDVIIFAIVTRRFSVLQEQIPGSAVSDAIYVDTGKGWAKLGSATIVGNSSIELKISSYRQFPSACQSAR